MSNNIQLDINYVCNEINRRIKQMTYNEESHIREFLEGCRYNDDDFLSVTDDDTSYIASVLNVNDNCIYDVVKDSIGIYGELETDEDDERFWDEQGRADDLNDERRLGI